MPLPSSPIIIHGGCNCRAIRYEINIPEHSDRPFHPSSDQTLRLPLVVICHCNDCRRATGGLTLAGILNPTAFVRVALLPRSSALPTPGRSRIEPPDADAELAWKPAAEVFRPDGVLSAPKDSFLAAYNPSKGVTRTFCGRCGTNVSYSRHPMPAGWPELLGILLGTIDREDLTKAELRPERHVYWDEGIEWVRTLSSEGDEGMPKHPHAKFTDVVH